ncbi:hypothetical protein B4U84_10755 [Westiellopsis prolifica IICB1]|nr:hypothetical protein B4U84_10755 [Westiellopsis prolifica IICB1]
MGHWALGIGHRASGIGHWASVILLCLPAPCSLLATLPDAMNRVSTLLPPLPCPLPISRNHVD